MITSDYMNIKSALNITLLCLSALLLPAFVLWAARQERLGKPVLIPNSLWRKPSFTATCVMVFFTWAVFNAFQYLSTLWFQRVLGVSSLQTSIRFLPMVIVGAGTNVFTGYLVDKVAVGNLVFISAVVSSAAPLLMAIGPADWSYWRATFPAMLLSPVHADGELT
jgi:Na+/melibiose symporter-like transporter